MAAFFYAIPQTTHFPVMIPIAVIGGLGMGIIQPALTAAYIDISDEQVRSRVMGLKGSASALGGVAGPLFLALNSNWFSTRGIFISAAVTFTLFAVLTLIMMSQFSTESGRESTSAVAA